MKTEATRFNPFPGLRSFRSDEDHLFFGREEQTLELMARLERTRFIAVVGSSGRGKSSLVRCGLLSRLQGGGMAGAGAHWEIAVMHPGGDPLRHLAEALLDAGLYDRAEENAVPHLLATLGRSQFGLVQAVRQASPQARGRGPVDPAHGTNFLLVVDQFEEIFRYDEAGAAESELANDFIAMLREACAQTDVPIYVVVTMRSDFIGDCSRFEGLAEAVNRGEYLIPRLSRDQFKSAIEGPIRVAGGRITPRLLQRLLNDVDEEQDQLPCLQHALMRTWRVWQGRADAEALDLEDYAQVGKMSQALSLHADEVYASLATERQRELCAAMFKALTVEGSEKRGIRRPRRLQALARILGVDKTEIIPVIDAYRQPDVSFLLPAADVELRDLTVIDLSHESLMRVWARLRGWVGEEAQSLGIFRRLSESATLWRQGRTGLCRDPELSIARAWLETNRPNAAWAEQYDGRFDEAMAYLQASTEAAEAEVREREERTRAAAARKARRQHWLIAGLATTVVGLLIGAVFGIREQRRSAAQASQTDYVLGSRLLDDGKLSEGLAYLVRSGSKNPENPLVTPRLLSVLTTHNFMLPVGAPLKLSSAGSGAAFMSNRRWLTVQSEDGTVRLIDVKEWRIVREYSFAQSVRRGGVVTARDASDAFAVVLADNSILLVDTQTGQPRLPPIVPPGKIFGRLPEVHLSPDGRWLAAAGVENVWVWDAGSGRLVTTLPNDNFNRQFDFSPDSQSIVTTHEHKVQVWSLPGGAPDGAAIDSPGTTYVTTFNEAGGRLLIGNNADGVAVIDLATRKPACPFHPMNGAVVWGLWFSPDGRRYVYTLSNDTAVVIDVATGKRLYPPLPHRGIAQEGDIVAGGRILFTNATDGLFRLWDLNTGSQLAEATARQPRFSPAVSSRDGKTVVLFAADGNMYRFRPERGAAAPLALPRQPATTMFINFVPGSPARIAWATHDALKVIDVRSGRIADGGFDFPAHVLRGTRSSFGTTFGENDVITTELGPDNWHAWTIGRKGIAINVRLDQPPDAFGQAVYDVGRNLLVWPGGPAGQFTQETLGVWDLKTGRRFKNIRASGAIRAVALELALSPDGRHVVFQTIDDRVVHVDDINTAKELYTLKLDGRSALTTVCYTPDGLRLVSGDDWGTVEVWDAANGKLVRSTPRHRGAISRVEFSADGKYYASESTDGSVQVWNSANNEPVGELLEQTGSAGRPDFTNDGTRIVTPSSTGSARIWDVQTGLPISEPLSSHGDPVTLAAFSPDGRFVTAHGGAQPVAQHVRLWSVPPAAAGPTPAWLLTLATICAGETLADTGKFADATHELAKIDAVRAALAAAPQGDEVAAWGRWILSDDPNRSIAPGFTITPAAADKLAQETASAASP